MLNRLMLCTGIATIVVVKLPTIEAKATDVGNLYFPKTFVGSCYNYCRVDSMGC